MSTGSSSTAAVIEAQALQKRYGAVRALDGLDLSVRAGEVHGFLGPNGSGKSTTIRILLGLARASGGSASVFGRDPWNDAVTLHGRIAYVPGDVSLWPNLSGGEAIDLIARLRGGNTSDPAYGARRAELADAFQFDPAKKARTYSKGNRQKVALIAAFATPADLYVLDEPTSGLDPVMEAVFSREISRLAASGATVLLSSHILSEVERLCDRVSIIRAGKTVETGTLSELRHLTRTAFSVAAPVADAVAGPATGPVAGPATEPATGAVATAVADGRAAGLREALAGIPQVHDLATDAGRLTFTVDSDDVNAVLPRLGALGVAGLRVAPPSLEELFLRHYGDEITDSERRIEEATAR